MPTELRELGYGEGNKHNMAVSCCSRSQQDLIHQDEEIADSQIVLGSIKNHWSHRSNNVDCTSRTPNDDIQHNQLADTSSPETSNVSQPRLDGGLRAWLCVLGTFLTVMNTWGMINCFGAFQSYYVDNFRRPPSDISWIGSLEMFLLFFVGTFAGRLTDAGYFRSVVTLGTVLIVVGTFTASVSSHYWQTLLAQGVCVGLGNGCLFCPVCAVLSTYFHKRRALALGIGACGGSIGSIVFTILVQQLLPRVGFRWTLITIGIIQIISMSIALLCLKPRVAPRRTGPIIEWTSFTELEYIFYAVGCFMCFWGNFVGFFYISTYARNIQGMSYAQSLELVVIMNAISMVGRVLPNYFADYVGTLNMFVPTVAAGSLILFCWISVSSSTSLYGWTAVYGVIAGAIQSLFPSVTAALTQDPQKQGSRIGMVFTIVSFGVLTGPPIAGSLISALGGRYIGAQAFAGGSLIVGMALIVAARETKRRKMGDKNVWAKM